MRVNLGGGQIACDERIVSENCDSDGAGCVMQPVCGHVGGTNFNAGSSDGTGTCARRAPVHADPE